MQIPTSKRIKNSFLRILPEGVKVECRRISDNRDSIRSEELIHVKNAVDKRIAEYSTGRLCAKEVLSGLNIHDFPLLVGEKREPIWPKNISGSITHDGGFCTVAAIERNLITDIGIDLTLNTPLDKDLIGIVCTDKEIRAAKTRTNNQLPTESYKLLFSLKESVYKCIFPVLRRILEFQDIEIEIVPEGNSAVVIPCNKLIFREHEFNIESRFQFIGEYIITAAWIMRSG